MNVIEYKSNKLVTKKGSSENNKFLGIKNVHYVAYTKCSFGIGIGIVIAVGIEMRCGCEWMCALLEQKVHHQYRRTSPEEEWE